MTSSRRGFFATLAALPAVVMGRKAIAHQDPVAFFVASGCLPPPSWEFVGGVEPIVLPKIEPEDIRAFMRELDDEGCDGKRLGS